jgi:hypothetical protein
MGDPIFAHDYVWAIYTIAMSIFFSNPQKDRHVKSDEHCVYYYRLWVTNPIPRSY